MEIKAPCLYEPLVVSRRFVLTHENGKKFSVQETVNGFILTALETKGQEIEIRPQSKESFYLSTR